MAEGVKRMFYDYESAPLEKVGQGLFERYSQVLRKLGLTISR